MITIKDFMEAVAYRISEGSKYEWNCYGSNAYILNYWNQDHNGHDVGIIFDTLTYEVYEATAFDYQRERAYRLINPAYKQAYTNEAQERSVAMNQAWDEVNFIDLDVDQDFLDKVCAIISGEDYDTRVQVPVEFTDEELFRYMKLAHERDKTFNQLVEEALRYAIEKTKPS
jgi:hypothetical protein